MTEFKTVGSFWNCWYVELSGLLTKQLKSFMTLTIALVFRNPVHRHVRQVSV